MSNTLLINIFAWSILGGLLHVSFDPILSLSFLFFFASFRRTKGCILPFPKKGDLGLAKNYRGITLTSIGAKIYNALLRNRIEPKIDNILRKNQNGFRRNRSTTSQILTIRRILEGVRAKKLQATLLFVDFTKAFDPYTEGRWNKSY